MTTDTERLAALLTKLEYCAAPHITREHRTVTVGEHEAGLLLAALLAAQPATDGLEPLRKLLQEHLDALAAQPNYQSPTDSAPIGSKVAGVSDVEVLDPAELVFSAWPEFRAGQHVGMVSGVKGVHLPTGITVICSHERSQHKNRDAALRALRAAVKP